MTHSFRFLSASALLAGGLALGLLPFVQASTFPDVESTAPYAESVDSLQKSGLVEGYDDGTFRPTQRVNRAEYLKVLMRAGLGKDVTSTNVYCFADFYGAEKWYWTYACAAKERGIVNGYPDGAFRGEKWVNTAEAIKMAVQSFNIPLPVYIREPDHWYDPYFDAAASTDVFSRIARTPDRLVTRADMAMIIAAFLETPGTRCDGHAIGESYPSPDGCNTCTCTENGAACTKRACAEKKCTSSSQCGTGEYCTTETGDCQSPCLPNSEAPCAQVCTGVCRARTALSCDAQKTSIDRKFPDNNHCSTNADCAVFIRGCSPYLTCGKAVRKDAVAGLERDVSEYAERCQDGPIQCAMCIQQTAVCQSGQCVLRQQ